LRSFLLAIDPSLSRIAKIGNLFPRWTERAGGEQQKGEVKPPFRSLVNGFAHLRGIPWPERRIFGTFVVV